MLSNLDSPPYQRPDSARNGVLSGYFPAWLNSLFEMNQPGAGRLISWPGMMVLLAVMGGCAVALADFNALYICISLIAIAFIMIDFRVGVLLLIIVMPISASYLFPHSIAGITGLNPLNLLLVGTLGAWILQWKGGLNQLLPLPLKWYYILPMGIAGVLGAPHVGEIPGDFYALNLISFNDSAGYLRDLLAKPLLTVLFAILVGAAVAQSQERERFMIPMLISIWVMGLMGIVFVIVSGVSLSELAGSGSREFFAPLGMHANDLGRSYAIAYALMLFSFAASDNFRVRAMLMASMVMVVIALVFTFSRGAFVGFLLVNLLFLLAQRNVIALLSAALFIAGIILLLPSAVYDRLGSGWESGLNAFSAGRLDDIWLPLLPAIWKSPFFGSGLSSILWSDAMREGYILQVTHPHNAYLRVLLDMGFCGLLLLGAYFVHVWRGFRSLGRDATLNPLLRGFYQGAAVGLVSFLLAGFAGSSLTPVHEQTFLWFAIGMMYGELARKSSEPSGGAA
jgi:O-antigen ligase